MKIIGSKNDFVGLNIYAPQFYIAASDKKPGWSVLPIPASFPHMNSEWLQVGPEVIYWAPRLAAKVWNIDTIYISENGTSSEDKLRDDGKVYDLDRIMYLRNYLAQLQRATAEGVPVKGYFLWSLMDNFEWIFGFEKRFGVYHVDFETQARVAETQRVILSRRGGEECDRGVRGQCAAPPLANSPEEQAEEAAGTVVRSVGLRAAIATLEQSIGLPRWQPRRHWLRAGLAPLDPDIRDIGIAALQ